MTRDEMEGMSREIDKLNRDARESITNFFGVSKIVQTSRNIICLPKIKVPRRSRKIPLLWVGEEIERETYE